MWRARPRAADVIERLLRVAHPGEPAFDMAVSHALLRRVARGSDPPTARVFVPGPTLAFGRLDQRRPGFGAAVDAARRHGYAPVLRSAGGHAVAYDAGSVVVELVVRQASIAEGIEARFAEATALVLGALTDAGAQVNVGELPREYCPGRWSIHVVGGPKVAGLAQRSVAGASLVTGVVVVEGGARIRRVLTDVYAALDLEFGPATAGALEDAGPATVAMIERTLARGLAAPVVDAPAPLAADAAGLVGHHAL